MKHPSGRSVEDFRAVRASGKRAVCLSGEECLIREMDPDSVPEEAKKSRRKASE